MKKMINAASDLTGLLDNVAVGMPDRVGFKTVVQQRMANTFLTTFEDKAEKEIESIDAKLEIFKMVKACAEERRALLLDYRAYARKIQAIEENPGKLEPDVEHRRRQKFAAAKMKYEIKDAETRAHLAYLDTLGTRMAEPEVEAFKQCFVEYFQNGVSILGDLPARDVDEVRTTLTTMAEQSRAAVASAAPAAATSGVENVNGNAAQNARPQSATFSMPPGPPAKSPASPNPNIPSWAAVPDASPQLNAAERHPAPKEAAVDLLGAAPAAPAAPADPFAAPAAAPSGPAFPVRRNDSNESFSEFEGAGASAPVESPPAAYVEKAVPHPYAANDAGRRSSGGSPPAPPPKLSQRPSITEAKAPPPAASAPPAEQEWDPFS
mmetsp:Transcript_19718/g.59718  ORF Transcript_19718/g.59718 Transcript_19718/m.59718 type:complete len:379 (+) Transcript_19718:315-1451(+)